MSPLVSVVLLCYNHEKYVKTAIESILEQTVTDFELIIVDDGSTDRTPELVRSYDDKRIRFIIQENRGPGYAGCKAVALARGKFIAAMSGDDQSVPTRFENQIKQLEKLHADITFCRPALIDDESNSISDANWPVFFTRKFANQEDLYRQLFFHGNFLCATSAMFRRSVSDKYGWVHSGLLQLQDYELWVRLAPNVHFHLSEERLFRYRILGNSGNLSNKKNKWRDQFERPLVMRRFFGSASPDFIKRAFPEIDGDFVSDGTVEFDAAIAKLYLLHKSPCVRRLGIERLLSICELPTSYKQLADATGWTVKAIYEELRKIEDDSLMKRHKLQKLMSRGFKWGKDKSTTR